MEGSDDSAEPQRPPSLTRKITTEYLRVGQLLLGKAEDDFLELSPSSAPAKDATAACSGAAASGGGPGDADSSGGGGSNGLPRRQRSPKRGGAFRNGAPRDRDDGGGAGGSRRRQGPARGGRGGGAADEEKGLEMRDTSGQPKGGRWEDEEEEEEGEDGTFVGSASGAGRHRAGAENIPPSSPSSSTSSLPQGITAHERGVRVWSGAGRAYGSGGGERWIGFAGSPRNRRPPVPTGWDDNGGATTAAAGGEDERLGNSNGSSELDPLAASSPSAMENGRRKGNRNGSRSRSRSTSPEAFGVAKQENSSSGGEESATFFKEEGR